MMPFYFIQTLVTLPGLLIHSVRSNNGLYNTVIMLPRSTKTRRLVHQFSFIIVVLIIITVTRENAFTPSCCWCPHSSEAEGSKSTGSQRFMGKETKVHRHSN